MFGMAAPKPKADTRAIKFGEQLSFDGTDPSAKQLQAARDQQGTGRKGTSAGQSDADEGLFGERDDSPKLFSRRTPADTIPESPLYVVHNLSAEKLRHVVDLGGLAAPSLAIARGDIGLGNFGEISLIGAPSMADPRGRGMKAFNADVYSPRQPRAQFDLNREGMKKLDAVLGEARDMGTEVSSELYDDKISREGLDATASSKVTQLAYLRTKNDAPKVILRKQEPLPAALRKFKGNRYWDILQQPGFEQSALAAEKEALAALPDDLRGKVYDRHVVVEDGVERLVQRHLDDAARRVAKANSPSEVDVWSTETQIRKRMDKKGREEAYRYWVQANFGRVLGAKFFRNEAGRRKPYQMDEIVREMTRTLRDGEGFNYGTGSVRSMVARPFKSVTAIKDARRSIVTDKEMAAIKDEANNELFALADKFAPYHASGKDFGWGDIFSEFLKDLAKGSIREWQTGIGRDGPIFNSPAPPELIADARAFLDKLRDLPTEYFEIKAQRAVALSEFTAALVPKNAPKDAVDALKAAGLEVVRYDQTDGNGRRDALQKVLPRVAFARRVVGQTPFYSATLRATEGIAQERGNGLQWLAMLRKQPGVKEEVQRAPVAHAAFQRSPDAIVREGVRSNHLQVPQERDCLHGGIVLEDWQQYRLPDRFERIGDGATALGLALGGKARIGLDPAPGAFAEPGPGSGGALAMAMTVLHVDSHLPVGDGFARHDGTSVLVTEIPLVSARSGQHLRLHPPGKTITPLAPASSRATPGLRLEPAANLADGAGQDGCRSTMAATWSASPPF